MGSICCYRCTIPRTQRRDHMLRRANADVKPYMWSCRNGVWWATSRTFCASRMRIFWPGQWHALRLRPLRVLRKMRQRHARACVASPLSSAIREKAESAALGALHHPCDSRLRLHLLFMLNALRMVSIFNPSRIPLWAAMPARVEETQVADERQPLKSAERAVSVCSMPTV